MNKHIVGIFTFLRVGFTEIYANFFHGPQGKGRSKLPLIGLCPFSIYGTYCGFKAGKILAQLHAALQIPLASWMPWLMAFYGFALYIVAFPATIYLIDHQRGKRTYRLGTTIGETPVKNKYIN